MTGEPIIAVPEPLPRGRRRVAFGVLLVLAGVCGVRMATLPETADNSPGALLVAAATSLTCAIWCAFDARVLGKRAPPVLLALVFIALPIGLPVYFLWSRAWRGIPLGVAFVAAFLFVLFASGFVAAALVESGS